MCENIIVGNPFGLASMQYNHMHFVRNPFIWWKINSVQI